MPIEDLKTKADLKRFLEEELLPLPITQVRGLGDKLGTSYAESFELEETLAVAEGSGTPLPGCAYTAPENMTILAIGTFDLEGSGVGQLWVNGLPIDRQAIHLTTDRETVQQNWPLTLNKGDTLQLVGVQFGGAGTTAQLVHTNLTIVRLS